MTDLTNVFDKKKLIEFNTVKDVISLTELIYDFNENINIEIDKNKKYDLNKLDIKNLKISENKKKLLEKLLSESPNSEIVNYYSLKNGTQVGITISHKKQRISIIFRGTNQIKDWLYDLMIWKTKLSEGIYVHSGFYKCLFEFNLFNILLNNLNNLMKEYPEYEIIVSGHSLGGALATLCGYLLTNNLNKNITVISFASPRVGNKKFSEDFNKKIRLRHYRFVNEKDIVTVIPYFYYYHVGNSIIINKKSILSYENLDNFKDCSNIFERYNPLDHFIEKYYDNLVLCKWDN
tara:strand:- start:1126 stop:1998 length:873 start_codon:yes stop_codon:yes gene_type:complete